MELASGSAYETQNAGSAGHRLHLAGQVGRWRRRAERYRYPHQPGGNRVPSGIAVRRTSQAQNATLVGHEFNVSNVLGIIGVLVARGVGWRAAIRAAEALTAVPGRMQQFGGQEAPLVVIDYAHTPDALEKTLASLRQVTQQRGGQLWCVFGCGGDRDPGKRPQMGAAAMVADRVVVTSDNPRSEDPAAIIADIVAGMGPAADVAIEVDTGADSGTVAPAPQVFEDRAAAILWAIKHAAKADVILLAGKGHETYQEIKGRKLPFLDADHAALALAARVTMKGAGG